MKNSTIAALLAAALLAGCASPYDYVENWLIREDPVRPFAIHADVIYLQDALYTNVHSVAAMLAYAHDEVGNGRFSRVARVFSPLVANADDLELAMKCYFWHHHDGNRPFFFIGEGAGGALLKAYEDENIDDLRDDGFVAGYYSEKTGNGFVTNEMVREIHDAVVRVRYREHWGREMPADMQKRQDEQSDDSN